MPDRLHVVADQRARRVSVSSARGTIMSIMPCSSRNSAVWNPSGQFLPRNLLDDAGTGETDQGTRLGQHDIGNRRVGGGDATVAGVHEDGEVGHARSTELGQGGHGLRHLHEREESLVHASAARGRYVTNGSPPLGRPFDGPYQLFAVDGSHAGAEELEVADGERHRIDRRSSPAANE